ncbi:MAG: ABC transporter substrate-binding protein [Myxococcota bacterium]
MRLSRRQGLVGILTGAGCRSAPAEWRTLSATGPRLSCLPFWVAMGGGLFAERGLHIDFDLAEHPSRVVSPLERAEHDVAIIDAEALATLVSRRASVVVVGRLNHRTGANLVVDARHRRNLPSREASLTDRVQALRSLRIGMAPRVERQWAAVLASASSQLRPEVVRLYERDENLALAAGDVDGLFTTSPQLEHALVRQGALLYIAPSLGEVPALDEVDDWLAVAPRKSLEHRVVPLARFVSALEQARRLIVARPDLASHALLEVLPDRLPAEVEAAFRIYAGTVPPSLRPRANSLRRTRRVLGLSASEASFAQIDDLLDARFTYAAERRPIPYRNLAGPTLAIASVGIAGWALRRHRSLTPH